MNWSSDEAHLLLIALLALAILIAVAIFVGYFVVEAQVARQGYGKLKGDAEPVSQADCDG
jgi:small-conductance mechanosensitive channel